MAALWAIFALFLGTSAALKENLYARLLDDLFEDTGYNKNAIPLEIPADKDSNKNALNVGVGMSIISMDYDQAGIMSASTWFKATWKDYRLQWDPKQYGGIENIKVPATMVWRPDLSVYNSADWAFGSFDDRYASGITNALIYSNGKVLWIPPLGVKVLCGEPISTESLDDPVDCNIKIGSWTYDGHHLNLTAYAGDEVLELSDMSKNTPYIVTSQKGDAIQNKYYECCAEPYMSFNFGFTMKRAFAVEDGKKVMKIDSKEFEELFEAYKVSFTGL